MFGTTTGRLSSSENIRGTGLNLQNIPEGIRDVFVAPPGAKWVKVDLSQVEARLVAYMSQDREMMRVFETGGDVHKLVASMLSGKPEKLITKQERQKAKKLGHAANYMIGPMRLADEARVSMAEAKSLLQRYYSTFRIPQWHDEIIGQLAKNRTLITPLGRKHVFFERWSPELFKQAIAFGPQSTNVDHINQAAVRINLRTWQMGIELAAQVHDELDYIVPEEHLDRFLEILREELSKPIVIHGRHVVIPIDIGVGNDWKNVEKI